MLWVVTLVPDISSSARRCGNESSQEQVSVSLYSGHYHGSYSGYLPENYFGDIIFIITVTNYHGSGRPIIEDLWVHWSDVYGPIFNPQIFTDRKPLRIDLIHYNNDNVSKPVPGSLKGQNLIWLYHCYHDSHYFASLAATWICGI